MAYAHTNSKGRTYYLHSKEPRCVTVDNRPCTSSPRKRRRARWRQFRMVTRFPRARTAYRS